MSELRGYSFGTEPRIRGPFPTGLDVKKPPAINDLPEPLCLDISILRMLSQASLQIGNRADDSVRPCRCRNFIFPEGMRNSSRGKIIV